MNQWVICCLFCISACAIGNVKGTTSAIPELLQDCYRSNLTRVATPPTTIHILVELIRKVEFNHNQNIDMRILATSMLHGVIFDGVRQSSELGDVPIPFRASGEQFYKYKLTVDYLTSGESSLFPRDALTTPELCFLHKITSNTVEPFQRGDESSTCNSQSSMPFNIEMMDESKDSRYSACPVKSGDVKTKWGPVSPGHIIAGVASAWQPTEAPFARIEDAINNGEPKNGTTAPPVKPSVTTNTNNVNNVWVSTIVGDLANAILNQASLTPELGTNGFWNDTLLPRVYYLNTANWDMTVAQILGGIDALAIADCVKNSSTMSRTRLSQLIDMYYSERGIGDNRQYKATNRSATLHRVLGEINLEEQVYGTAKLLQQVGIYSKYLSDDDIRQLAGIAVAKFLDVAGNITKTYDSAEYINGGQMKAPVEIVVILDGTFSAYSAQQMLYALSEAAQVSHYGSNLGVINGQSGVWIANVTGDLFQLFSDLQRAENEWPATFSLGQSLETAIYYYQNKTTTDCSLGVAKPMGRSILIVGYARLTSNDLEKSQRALDSIKKSNPEINVIYVTSTENKNNLDEFINQFKDNFHVVTPPKDTLSFVEQVSRTLSSISGNIMNFYCQQSQVRFEDYITPDVETFYEIRKEYIAKQSITTKFTNSNYGDLTICASGDSSDEPNAICKNLTVNGEISFDSSEICASVGSTCNLQFRVSLNSTQTLCAENDCRYPDQVRLLVTWRSSSGSVPPICANLIFIVTMILFFSS